MDTENYKKAFKFSFVKNQKICQNMVQKASKKDPKNDTQSIRISVLFLASHLDQKNSLPCPKWAPRLWRRPWRELAGTPLEA